MLYQTPSAYSKRWAEIQQRTFLFALVFVLVSSIGVYGEKIFLNTVFVSPDIALAAKQFVTIFRSDLGKMFVLYFSLIRWQSFTTGSNKILYEAQL